MIRTMSKAEAASQLRQLGLDTTPTAIYRADASLTASAITDDLGAGGKFVARCSSPTATLNQPRLVDATAEQVCDWVATLPADHDIIIQPYDELAYCGQLAAYPEGFHAELISGIWEMTATREPLRLSAQWPESGAVTITTMGGAVDEQPCHWRYEPEATSGRVENWMVASTLSWMAACNPALRQLLSDNADEPFGMKFHYTPRVGVVAQNLYADVPDAAAFRTTATADEYPTITQLDQPIPQTDAVAVEVAVRREDALQFDVLMSRLRSAGVSTVYLRSGLLSHIAIRLREEGFTVLPVR
jgi:hypothetical protein